MLSSQARRGVLVGRRTFSAVAKSDALRPLDAFLHRHLGPRDSDISGMLKAISPSYATLEDLTADTVPTSIRLKQPLTLADEALTESEALAKLKKIASKNRVLKSFIGMGFYDTITPGVILRNILENPGWYTSYTPYQAEISQGRLESLLNFQTMVCDLTGMDISNASLLDEATSAAEAMNLCQGHHNGKRNKFFIGQDVHPQNIETVKTRASGFGIEITVGDALKADFSKGDYSGILVQYPNTHGTIDAASYESLCQRAHRSDTLVVGATDLLALCLIRSPGELGMDIAVGSAQRFGVPMGFGGPHAGFLATRDAFKRRMPGRIIGVSIDAQGNRALRMAMQTREQHIRRDKATSNICTAQALLANIAAMYAVYHGPEGLAQIASRVRTLAGVIAGGFRAEGFAVSGSNADFFDTIVVDVASKGMTSAKVAAEAVKRGINVRVIDDKKVGISTDETTDAGHIEALFAAFGVKSASLDGLAKAVPALSVAAKRTSAYLTHPVFNTYRSETQLLRYIYKLQNRDLSLTYSMISLGSCTMKLNATSEMIPITWHSLADMHPFTPPDQAVGYAEMIKTLSDALCRITGFAAVSVQPNSGAQGEYAGLMVIREYHRSRGDKHRNVCLIPVSAHGTNPASAVMAGMKVVVVASDDKGNVDMVDLKAKAVQHKNDLAALMVTYPSTFGVFEEGVADMCTLIHSCGGQVYMDGANMNAQVGLTSPGHIGADVCHLNLHKTFCIPHGGGGPGVGAIGVAKHLAAYLPGHPVIPTGGDGVSVVSKKNLTVSAAPYGSALILPISWMYIQMLGGKGLTKATQTAILNANYLAARLSPHYPVVYTGHKGRVAHEMIIDLRPFKARSNNAITEQDVAKRLIDYGFHSPTMSWPVAGTLMIEPTESEDRAELDRFADALIAIRAEIEEVLTGKGDPHDNLLTNAPHTASVIGADTWNRPYSRERAAFPTKWIRENKFWPSVGRVDNVFGDRNLVCTCPPIETYA